MILAVDAARLRPGGLLARSLAGLAARGHAVRSPSPPREPGPLAGEVEVRAGTFEAELVVGEGRAAAAAWLAARTRARAVVLALDAERHGSWNALDRWAWGMSGAYGLVHEADANAFLARLPAHDHARVALWPALPGEDAPVLAAGTTTLERACERALARRSAGPGRAGLFADRDGTLIAERDHLSEPAAVELLPGVAAALRAARGAGLPVILISNQAGVGRGLFTEGAVHATMARLRVLLRAEGVELDAVRFCPHAPDAGCDCRKPGTRLLLEAAEDLRVSLPDSLMVGDKWIDVEAGLAAGAAGVLVRTGHGAAELAAERAPGSPAASAVADDLPAAVHAFLARLD